MNLKLLSTKILNLHSKLESIEHGIDTLDQVADEILAQQSDLNKALSSMLDTEIPPVETDSKPLACEPEIEEVPEELSKQEWFEELCPLFAERAKEFGSEYKADEIMIYCKEISKAKYDSDGKFISDKNEQGELRLEAKIVWSQMIDALIEIKHLSEEDVPDIDQKQIDEIADAISDDDGIQNEINEILNELEEDSEPEITDDELDSLLEGIN